MSGNISHLRLVKPVNHQSEVDLAAQLTPGRGCVWINQLVHSTGARIGETALGPRTSVRIIGEPIRASRGELVVLVRWTDEEGAPHDSLALVSHLTLEAEASPARAGDPTGVPSA